MFRTLRNVLRWLSLLSLSLGLLIARFPPTSHNEKTSATPAYSLVSTVKKNFFAMGLFAERHLGMANPFKESWNQVVPKGVAKQYKQPCKHGKNCVQQAKQQPKKQAIKQPNTTTIYHNVNQKQPKFLRQKGIKITPSGDVYIDPKKKLSVHIVDLTNHAIAGKQLLRGTKKQPLGRKTGNIGKANAIVIDSQGKVYVLQPEK